MTLSQVEARADGKFAVSGALLIANVPDVLREGLAFLASETGMSGERVYDFSAVKDADSSALALIFVWQRDAKARGISIRFTALPDSMTDLAALYGVTGFLPV